MIFNVVIVATNGIHTTSHFQTPCAAVTSLHELNSRGLHSGRGEEKGISFYQIQVCCFLIPSHPPCNKRRIQGGHFGVPD